MQVVSELVEIPNNQAPTTEYIEGELTKRNINPLRWAVVHVSDKIYTVSVANLKEQDEKDELYRNKMRYQRYCTC